MLQTAPSGYHRHAAEQYDPALRSARAQRDDLLIPQIQRAWHANFEVYGADRVWRQLKREGVDIARCIVGWRVSPSMHTDFVLDALEPALYACQPELGGLNSPNRESVELATLEWVHWFNHERLLEPIGYIPPAEAEAQYYRQLANTEPANVT